MVNRADRENHAAEHTGYKRFVCHKVDNGCVEEFRDSFEVKLDDGRWKGAFEKPRWRRTDCMMARLRLDGMPRT
jgi:hypothetical protein